MQLRETQAKILEYSGGKMGIAAVPGSGKTFILTRLAAKLIAEGQIDVSANQQVLIVTYLNASVDNFKARIRELLISEGLNPDVGYDVRTLHSLGLEIMRSQFGGDRENNLIVLDQGQSSHFLSLAVDQWQQENYDMWLVLLPDTNENVQAKWRRKVESMAAAFIRNAKNLRYRPLDIREALSRRAEAAENEDGVYLEEPDDYQLLLEMLTGIYTLYQSIILRQGGTDFDDLIRQAVDLVEKSPELQSHLRSRWPYVLEDEAQDSVPLQEILLDALTGENGNWVRVGDPNQAITSSFTSAHPRYLSDFLDRDDVLPQPLPHSGRCAPLILDAANELMAWTLNHHPVPEVRDNTFRPQKILPTPAGDAQPNPPDDESRIVIRVYTHREDEELPKTARLAALYTEKFPDRTVAVLCPTHDIGHTVAENLDQMGAPYDNLLRGGTREREIAGAYYGLLSLLANPLRSENFKDAFLALHQLGHPAARVEGADLGRFEAVLRSVRLPESLVYPADAREDIVRALPAGIPHAEDLEQIAQFTQFIQKLFALRSLPIDDLLIAMGDEMLAHSQLEYYETDLAIAYQMANILRSWGDLNPDWRLPEFLTQVKQIADGRQHISVISTEAGGFEPKPGRITLTTQHGSKGLEWDAVFLVGIDSGWIPNTLDGHFVGVDDQFGVDLSAEVTAQLRKLMTGDAQLHPGHSPTDSVHIDVISERLRLLYVGITRAKRFLQISRSRRTRHFQVERNADPTTAMGALYQYIQTLE